VSKTFIDVSHSIEDGLVTYKGLPAPTISDYLTHEGSRSRYAPGTEFCIGKIEMVANTGTYVDSPFHRYAGAKDLAELPLSSLADLEGLVVRAKGIPPAIAKNLLQKHDVRGKAVLINTGWDRYRGTEKYFGGHPFLTKDAAEWLRDSGAAFVGIDSLNIDDTNDLARPAHSILLAADIPIGEHLCNLGSVPDSGFRFFAVPIKIKKFGSFPVRAFVIV
jgi:arylformamidase